MSTPIDPAASRPPAGESWAGGPEAGPDQGVRVQDSRPSPGEPQEAPLGPPSTPYLPTILSGLVVLTVTVLVALVQLTDVQVDLGLVLPVGMVAAGALLVLGAVLAAVRAGRRAEG